MLSIKINFLFNETNPLIILILVGIEIKTRIFQRIVSLPLLLRILFNFTLKCQRFFFQWIIFIFCIWLNFSLVMRILSFCIREGFSRIENIGTIIVFLFIINYRDLELCSRGPCSYIGHLVIVARFFWVVMIMDISFIIFIKFVNVIIFIWIMF